MGRAGGMHSPEQPAQCVGTSRGDAKSCVERPGGDSPAEEMQVLLRRRSTG